MQAKIIAILVAIGLFIGSGFLAYNKGAEHERLKYIAAQAKANAVVVAKNETMKDVSVKAAEVQIIYKDKIVTKYKTIEKEVIKYEETPAANIYLDPEFIRLHNTAAAANGEIPITSSTIGVEGEDQTVGVTTGQAIGVISRNYQEFYQCKRKVEGWNSFYEELQNTVSDKQ